MRSAVTRCVLIQTRALKETVTFHGTITFFAVVAKHVPRAWLGAYCVKRRMPKLPAIFWKTVFSVVALGAA